LAWLFFCGSFERLSLQKSTLNGGMRNHNFCCEYFWRKQARCSKYYFMSGIVINTERKRIGERAWIKREQTVCSSIWARSGPPVKYTDKTAWSIFTAFGAVTREQEEASR
jgi:hypothetical protein